eukprot:m.183952 g.183952  ORF g.183952 m.183952 type:complete len:60 (+) comp16661_c2_seq1:218-397(+)
MCLYVLEFLALGDAVNLFSSSAFLFLYISFNSLLFLSFCSFPCWFLCGITLFVTACGDF